jgi:hypothetical protein
MELLWAKVARIHSYGITVDDTQLAIILLANVELAASEDYGCEFCPAIQAIRHKYPYNHTHNATSIQAILIECAGTDAIQKLNEAPAHHLGSAHAVSDQVSYLTKLLQDQTYGEGNAPDESAAAVQSDSDTSADASRCHRHHNATLTPKGTRHRLKSHNNTRQDYRDNPCPHCKKFKRYRQHPNISHDNCFWNKKYYGYRPKGMCNEMELRYKPHHKFTADLGGYPADSSGSEGDTD